MNHLIFSLKLEIINLRVIREATSLTVKTNYSESVRNITLLI